MSRVRNNFFFAKAGKKLELVSKTGKECLTKVKLSVFIYIKNPALERTEFLRTN
jgi:hypothetical protein